MRRTLFCQLMSEIQLLVPHILCNMLHLLMHLLANEFLTTNHQHRTAEFYLRRTYSSTHPAANTSIRIRRLHRLLLRTGRSIYS